jgi:outer membrane protein
MKLFENIGSFPFVSSRLALPAILFSTHLFLCHPFMAAQEQNRRIVTLREAIQITLANNHDLASSRLEVERADARVREAIGSALPKIDLSANYTRAILKPVFFLPGDFFGQPGTIRPVEIGSTHSWGATLSANQILFNSAVFVGMGAAKIYSRAAREMNRAKEVEVVTNTRKAFCGVLVAAEARNLMQQTMKNTEENLRNIRLMVSQGLVSEYDQLRAEVALENLRPEVINAENAYRLSLNNLNMVMGLPPDSMITVSGSLEYVQVSDSLVNQAMGTVLEVNPGLAALRHQADVNDAITSAYRSEYLPVLSLFGNYQYQAQNNDFKLSTQDLISTSLVGLTLTLNIFNGLATTSRVEQAELEYRKTQEQVTGVSRTLQSSTEAVLLNLNKARLRIEAQGKTVEQAERGYKIAQTRYNSGLSTLLELNDAQLAQVRASVNKIQSIYDYLVASADLDQLLGRIPEPLQPTTHE